MHSSIREISKLLIPSTSRRCRPLPAARNVERILLAKIDLAKVEVREKNARQAIPNLRALIKQADDLSLKYSSVESSIFMAEAMMQSHDSAHARQELQRALLLADKFGQQSLSAQAHYLLATIARDSNNNTEAPDNYRSVDSYAGYDEKRTRS